MIYEEKFEIVVEAIREAKKYTPTGYDTKLKITEENRLLDLDLDDIASVIYQLENTYKVIKPISTANVKSITGIDPWSDEQDFFALQVLPAFQAWYEEYILEQKTNLKNLDYINMLRIYDVVLDINEQIQLTHKTTVHIHLILSMIRFRALFPADTTGLRDEYCENRLGSLKYLKEKGIINEYTHGQDGWDTVVTVSFVLSKFNDFYEAIKDGYVKLNKENDRSEKQQNTPTKINREASEEAVWSDDFRWEGNNFVFGEYGSIPLQSKDRKYLFKALTDKKGGWATISELKGNKDAGYVRSTIKQIEDRLPEKAKEHIKIISTQEDDSIEKPNAGAYRIKVQR